MNGLRASVKSGLIAVGLLMGVGSVAAQSVSEQYLLAAANRDRAEHQLQPLRASDQLALAARLHAYEMANRRTISHQFDGEPELAKRAGDAGAHFSLITENVAEAPNSALIHDLWMNSAGHRANLLDANVDSVGIAVVQKNGQLYAVEDFARTVAQLSIKQQEQTVARLLAGSGLTVDAGVEDASKRDARQTCTMSTGYVGKRQPWFVMRYTANSLDHLPAQLTSQVATGKYHEAVIGACVTGKQGAFTSYSVAVMLFP